MTVPIYEPSVTSSTEKMMTPTKDSISGTTAVSEAPPTVSEGPTAVTMNDSLNSTETVAPTKTTEVSSSPDTTISTNAISDVSTTNSTQHTSGPTESIPAQSSTETTIKANDPRTGSTDQTEHTVTTSITTSPSNPVTKESTSSETHAPTNYSEITPQSTTQALIPKETSTTDATTEHNVELPKALSPGSVAAITIIVILLVLVIFGGATYWKIRHSSYGRLLEDQDYGSLGNYNNPLYDDS
ncbi:Prostate androgen-regulated mucin-like protein 1 [Pristimantis euphronides]